MRTLSLLIILALVPSISAAGSSKREAKKRVLAAMLDYKLGRFKEALEGYSAAYQLFPAPALLFNIGQCHKNLKSYDRAVFFFEGFLREQPDAPNREVVEDLIKEANGELAKQAAAEAEEKTKRAEEERRSAAAEREAAIARANAADQARLPAATQATAAAAPPTAPPLVLQPAPISEVPKDRLVARPPSILGRWWFWPVVGGVAAAATGGAVLYLSSSPGPTLPEGSLGTLDRR